MTVAPAPVDSSSQRSDQSDWWLLGKLWPYAKRHLRLFLLAIAFLPPLAISQAIQPAVLKQAIDGPITNGNLGGLWVFVAILLGISIVRLVLQAAEGFVSQKLGQLMTADIRNDLFKHVISLPSSYFDRTPVGKLITRITSDVEALGDVFSTGAIGVVGDLVNILAIAGIMLWERWTLAIFLIGLILPMAWLVIWLQQQYRNANFKVREELSSLNSALQENIQGVKVVQMFRREGFNSEQYYDNNIRYIKEVDKTIFFDSTLSAVLEWVSWIGVAGVLWLGGRTILQPIAEQGEAAISNALPFIPEAMQANAAEPLTFGTLYAFILFSSQFFNPLRQLAEKFTSLQAGFTAVERITGMLELPLELTDPEQPLTLAEPLRGEVAFKHVNFGYKADELVIKDLNFTLRPGEKIALVGPTGAGKSSIIRLLSRLYDVTEGSIAIDGVDIRELRQADLHRYVGTILQDSFLFSGTIRDNITLGENYSDAEVRRAAQLMNVDSFIMDLPQGYDTVVRERGNNLSSGQKQLLAFARATIRNPKILILDEATASLDVGTEALIQEALETLLGDRTAIIIAHRLATIRNVDRILVLQRGQLKEQGTHVELMAQKGIYANLYQLQSLQSA